MLLRQLFLVFTFSTCIQALANKEVALTFDDAPARSSLHYKSIDRTNELIRKLKDFKVPSVMVFSNGCKAGAPESARAQLAKYVTAGYQIENHTCSHLRLDDVGYSAFSADVKKGEELLKPLFHGQKYFRFPYLNEGSEPKIRDQMRSWLKDNGYRNGMITGDNEDPTFSAKINEAKRLGKKISYERVKEEFVDHIITSLECADNLALKTIGRSPKHVLLLHEADATVMFIGSLVEALRGRGWKVISAAEAYSDHIYKEEPKNTYAGFGIVAQLSFEKTGEKKTCYDYSALVKRLNKILAL